METSKKEPEFDELTPLELDSSGMDLDLTIPDLEGDDRAASVDPSLDDDLLNLPTLDDLEESSGSLAGGEASLDLDAPADLHMAEAEAQPDDGLSLETSAPASHAADEDESATLSDEELAHILDTSGDDLFGSPEGDLASAGGEMPALELDEPASELALPDDLSMEEVPHDLDLSGTEPMEDQHAAPSALGGDDDEGPIALSEDELGSIMSDVSETTVHEGEASTPDFEYVAEAPAGHPDDLDVAPADMPDLSMPDDSEFGGTSDKDEEITLSDAELESVLLDTPMAMDDDHDAVAVHEPMTDHEPMEMAAAPSALGGDEDEGPIALSEDELGSIMSDVSETPAESEEHPATSLMDAGDEDEIVALSDSELDLILEDVEAPAESDAAHLAAAGTGAPSENVIVLDDYEGIEEPEAQAPIPEPSPERAAFSDQVAAAEGLDKKELKKMISYLDSLFDKLPDDAVREFSRSEYFNLYQKIMSELGLQ